MIRVSYSSITDNVIGTSVRAITEGICNDVESSVNKEDVNLDYSDIVLHPICIPDTLGVVKSEIKISRNSKILEIFFNMPYDIWTQSSKKEQRILFIRQLRSEIFTQECKRLPENKRAMLLSCIEFDSGDIEFR